ncbi:MAG: hypothetical protein Q4A19_09065 [Johnsonella sp.]|nr:hypothetical protein [Johnsonella sp.]
MEEIEKEVQKLFSRDNFLENNIIKNKHAEEIGIKRHILAFLAPKGVLERVKTEAIRKKMQWMMNLPLFHQGLIAYFFYGWN